MWFGANGQCSRSFIKVARVDARRPLPPSRVGPTHDPPNSPSKTRTRCGASSMPVCRRAPSRHWMLFPSTPPPLLFCFLPPPSTSSLRDTDRPRTNNDTLPPYSSFCAAFALQFGRLPLFSALKASLWWCCGQGQIPAGDSTLLHDSRGRFGLNICAATHGLARICGGSCLGSALVPAILPSKWSFLLPSPAVGAFTSTTKMTNSPS